ncbi:SafA/ExsA family spore coat assembly protein [Brevibacillus migulae]|uniref:SafA/ExsA family spore coat assembly protein n=1 Tax=Brevibacillus migulae TaxID=1644114 RepID=UPI00106F068F|nr:SafA/ExsA family spore coat assembly protein [Brevibacillus migulae]
MKKLLVCMAMLCLCLSAFSVPSVDAQTPETDVYIVQPGDSLWKIAQRYQVGLSEIIQANPQFRNPALIYPGNKVTIPLVPRQVLSIEEQVIQMVNAERAKAGLRPLANNWQLSRVARIKSQDMRDRRYFSHISPTYGSPFDMMRAFNISYHAAGENIAAGQRTAAQVMQGWMNSPGHRQNILNPQYTQIGVGYVEGGAYGVYWTQMFIRP